MRLKEGPSSSQAYLTLQLDRANLEIVGVSMEGVQFMLRTLLAFQLKTAILKGIVVPLELTSMLLTLHNYSIFVIVSLVKAKQDQSN